MNVFKKQSQDFTVEDHFNNLAPGYDSIKNRHQYYYRNLKHLISTLIPPEQNVLEIGCGTGQMLSSLKPRKGIGVDISPEMIKIAQKKYTHSSNLHFSTRLPSPPVKLDYIFMTDVVEHLSKPLDQFKQISSLMDGHTLFINTMANPLWEPILMFAEKLGLKMPEGPHHRWTYPQLEYWCLLSGMKIVKHDYFLLVPVYIPGISTLANRFFEKYFKRLAFIEYFIAVKLKYSKPSEG